MFVKNLPLRRRFSYVAALIQSLLVALLLTGCSNTTQSSQQSVNSRESIAQPSPSCSTEEYKGGSQWIKGQLKAFGESAPSVAYSYTSENFRKQNSLDSFVAVIKNQYSMLLELKSYQVGECKKSEGYFLFTVALVDNSNLNYTMQYVLSRAGKNWGVEGAAVYASGS